MADIYRKSMLEKLSSPDRLDRLAVIASPLTYLAVLGGIIIAISGCVWLFFGA